MCNVEMSVLEDFRQELYVAFLAVIYTYLLY